MKMRRASTILAAMLCFSLASCTLKPGRAVLKNATGADLVLLPLTPHASVFKAGETIDRMRSPIKDRMESVFERGGCLYTYPKPDFSRLPGSVRGGRPRVVVEVGADMRLHLFPLSKDGVQGTEIVAGGFPLRPMTFCGRRGGG